MLDFRGRELYGKKCTSYDMIQYNIGGENYLPTVIKHNTQKHKIRETMNLIYLI